MSQQALRYFVGVDLDQVSDFTALAVLERPIVSTEDVLRRRRPNYALRHLCRLPLGTPYPTVVQSVVSMLGAEEMSWRDRPHDDLVLAVALAAWEGERNPPSVGIPMLLGERWGQPLGHGW